MKKAEKATKPQSYLISDDKGLTLRIETEGKWIIVSSPFDPELVTQVKSIDEIFPMAYEVKQGLEAIRAEMAHNRDRNRDISPTPRRRKSPAAGSKKRSSSRSGRVPVPS